MTPGPDPASAPAAGWEVLGAMLINTTRGMGTPGGARPARGQ